MDDRNNGSSAKEHDDQPNAAPLSSFRIDSGTRLFEKQADGTTTPPKKGSSSPPPWRQRLDALGSFCLQHFLPLGLVTLVIFGALVPAPGKALSSGPTSEICMSIIFVISGLTLKTADIKEAVHEWMVRRGWWGAWL